MSQSMTMLTDMAVSNIGQANVDNEKQRINNLSKSQNKEQKEKELRKAAEGFEAIFIQKMWEQMRASVPKNGMHYSKEEEYWQSMYNQELGKSMAAAGGIGLADMMVQQLTQERYKSPPTKAMSRIRMAVEPAPLVAENTTTKTAPQQAEQHTQPSVNTVQTRPVNTENLYESYTPEQNYNAQNASNYSNVAMANQQLPSQTATPQATQQQASAVQEAQEAPQVVKRTYITNLPPSERKHAILDKNGRPIRKTTSPMQNKVIQARVPNTAEYIDRSLSIPRNVKVVQPQNSDPVPFAQHPPTQVGQMVQQNQIPIPNQNTQNPIPTTQGTDVLAGITTRYVSQVERMAMIEASSILSQNVGSFYTPAMENFVETEQIARNEQKQEAIINKLSNALKTPTLEDALKVGTFVASLDEKQKKQFEKIEPQIKEIIGGGPEISSPPVFQNVSATAPQTNFIEPLQQTQGMISSNFGWRLDPITQKRAWHTGVDIKSTMGTPVSAAQSGIVSFAGVDPELGNTIIIDHGNGIQSVYGHNSELLVKQGETINSGTLIAKVGSSGRTNGAHLHFEIRQNGLSINPEPYLIKEEIS